MKKLIILSFWLLISTGANAQYSFEDVINSERFGHLQLNYPRGISIGADEKIYICDSGNSRVVILTADGSIDKIIQVEAAWSADGNAYPQDVAVASNGNIYVASVFGVFIYTANGTAIGNFGTEWGTEPGQFTNAASIAINNQGTVYVSDHSRIQAFELDGSYLFQFPLQLTATGSIAYTYGISLDPVGNLYVADFFENRIQVFSNTGVFMNFIPLPASPYSYSTLADIAVDQSFDIYVNDYLLNALYKVTTPGANPYHVAGGSVAVIRSEIPFEPVSVPLGIAVSNAGVLYESISNTNTVSVLNPATGRPVYNVMDALRIGAFSAPNDIVIGNNGNVYVVDEFNSRIQVFDPYGNFLFMFGLSGTLGSGKILNPFSIAIDDSDVIYVRDLSPYVSRFDQFGNFIDSKDISSWSESVSISVDNSFIYLGYSNSRIDIFDKNWNSIRTINTDSGPGQTGTIWNIAALDGNVYIACDNGLKVFDATGNYLNSYSSATGFLNVDVNHENIVLTQQSQLTILNMTFSLVQQINTSYYISGVSASAHRIYTSERFEHHVTIWTDLPVPAIQLSDAEVNYADLYTFIPVFSSSPAPISLQASSDLVTVFPDQWVWFNGAGEVNITARQSASQFFRKSSATAILKITKAPLQFSADNKNSVYGDNIPELTYSVTGFRFDDTISELDQTPVPNTIAAANSPVGEYGIEFNDCSDKNYEFIYNAGTLTITKALLTVKADDQFMTYGDANPVFTASYTGFKNTDTAFDLDAGPEFHPVGTEIFTAGNHIISVSNAQDNNYDFEYAEGVLSVSKAILSITADDKRRIFKQENPELTVQYSGFRHNEDQSVLTELFLISTTADINSSAGEYPIVVEQGGSLNYDIVHINGVLTIDKADQSLSFPEFPLTILNTHPPLELNAVSDAGLSVIYETTGPAAVTGQFLELSEELGIVTIVAVQPGDENYNAAPSVERSFEVILDPVLGVENSTGRVHFYPNPANDFVFFKTKTLLVSAISLVDVKGIGTEIAFKTEESGVSFNVAGFQNGLYIVKIKTGSGDLLAKKLLIQH